jgi:hypothetical protein
MIQEKIENLPDTVRCRISYYRPADLQTAFELAHNLNVVKVFVVAGVITTHIYAWYKP